MTMPNPIPAFADTEVSLIATLGVIHPNLTSDDIHNVFVKKPLNFTVFILA